MSALPATMTCVETKTAAAHAELERADHVGKVMLTV